ncbi:hypothetical protein [Ensifer sp. B1-9]|uniref:hypothetical protein n=1 Tax=Ensifer sp. B1-9 TaxID=3141455 RepID=UPI003D1AD174
MLDDDHHAAIETFYLRIASSPEEFSRIIRPQNAEDWLLRFQADTITRHMRIQRNMRTRAQQRGLDTLLIEEHASDFTEYLSYLPEYEKLLCEDIPRRYILTNNYDAMCLQTDFGKVIIVSEVLRYFLYFMNLAVSDVPGVPDDVRDSALRIAMRTMLLSETLDFDMDPRGAVPKPVDAALKAMVNWQMKFIVGHEFAHHILCHDESGQLQLSKTHRFSDGEDIGEVVGYLRQHAQEFEADWHSISVVDSKPTQQRLFVGGVSFLLALYVFETLAAEIDPAFGSINTHPQTTTRVRKLLEAFNDDPDLHIEDMPSILENYDHLCEAVLDQYREAPDNFTFYGSIYLGSWRGPVRVDRVDF